MMNNHLTSQEMEALLMEPKSGNRQPHLANCESCMDELESFQAAIADFRSAATASARQQYRAAAIPTGSYARPRMMWSMVAAAVLICTAEPILLHRTLNHADVVTVPQQQAQGTVSDAGSDAQLLSNVQDDLSASVPGPMLPLASTDTTSSTSASTNVAKENE
jgi:hypothetical protein